MVHIGVRSAWPVHAIHLTGVEAVLVLVLEWVLERTG